MDSRNIDAKKGQSGAKKGKGDKKNAVELKKEAVSGSKQIEPKMTEGSAVNMQTNQSQTTSMFEMHKKLKEVVSPSSSKPEDDDEYYLENEVDELYNLNEANSDDVSAVSIPMAHREYEKILRQLEAECRTHIKCEQQMKLHIECLQEKLDQVQKESEKNKNENKELMEKKQSMTGQIE